MDCSDYQLLMVPHILGRQGGLHVLEIVRLEAHLTQCESCAREYAEYARVIQAIRELPPEMLAQALSGPSRDGSDEGLAEEPIEASGGSSVPAPSIQLCSDKRLERRRQAQTLSLRMLAPAALAACLMLALTAWLFVHSSGRSNEAPRITKQNEAKIAVPAAMGTVQALGENGPESIRPVVEGQVLAASHQERLRIWDRHEVMLEPGTKLGISGSQAGGCQLKLSEGRIVASVHRGSDEGVFEVTTPEANLRITGTVFAVTATSGRTELRVTEGIVQLASLTGATQPVAAGQTYVTDGRAVVRGGTEEPPDVLAVATAVSQDPVDALRKCRWYKQRFAPLLALNDYLKAQKVDSDELTILAISADLWCIQYPKDPKANLPPYIQRKAGLERAAKFCGYEVRWLTPANADEAARLAREAISAGQLALGYGLPGGQDVQVLSAERMEVAFSGSPNGYRFLGEAKAAPWGLAVLAGPSGPLPDREYLAREAAEDIRQLLSGLEDAEYCVGQAAVEVWGAGVIAKDEDIRPIDPTGQALNAIGKLGPACQERFAALGTLDDHERWLDSCRRIEITLGTAGGHSDRANAAECEKDRLARRAELVADLLEVMKRQTAPLQSRSAQ